MNKILILFLSVIIFSPVIAAGQSDDAIQPWQENPWYRQYKSEPVLLLGASSDDNLFQWPADRLIPHPASMKAAGANYVRCTMSDRVDRRWELHPCQKIWDEKYKM
jgi:hypothetical protein